MTQKTKRIYHGPDHDPTAFWWDVKWSPAKKGVVINGSLEHAIAGMPGHSIGCRLSNAATDEKNKGEFPHPVYIAAFYKRMALIVDHLAKNGTPDHAVAYEHDYADFINLNDASNLEPIYKDKRFFLRPPQNRKNKKTKTSQVQPLNGNTAPKEQKEAESLQTFGRLEDAGHVGRSPSAGEEVFHPSSGEKKVATFRGAMGRATRAGILGRSAANQLARAVQKKA